MTDTPDDKFRPESIIDPYRAEIARLRALLVKACVRIANYRARSLSGVMVVKRIERIKKIYGIDLRYNGVGFEEDTTK